jgi:type IV secretion system protein TrbG
MPRWIVPVLGLCLLAGCAEVTPPQGASPPLPDDLATWSAPTPIAEPLTSSESTDLGEVPVAERPASPAEKVYAYKEGTAYKVPVPMGVPADVVLGVGEVVRNVVGGDRAPVEGQEGPRWEVKEGGSGSDGQARPHVFLTATQPGLMIGLVVTTTKRTYYLTCQSVQSTPIRAIRFTYPAAPKPAKVSALATIVPDASQSQRYHVGYRLESSQPPPVWRPSQVVDDGRKVYILLPPQMQYADAPMLRLVGPNGPELVNSRQYASVIIVDRIFNRAELRLGIGPSAETVTITRQPPRTIDCPGDADCPVWPQSTATAVRKE